MSDANPNMNTNPRRPGTRARHCTSSNVGCDSLLLFAHRNRDMPGQRRERWQRPSIVILPPPQPVTSRSTLARSDRQLFEPQPRPVTSPGSGTPHLHAVQWRGVYGTRRPGTPSFAVPTTASSRAHVQRSTFNMPGQRRARHNINAAAYYRHRPVTSQNRHAPIL